MKIVELYSHHEHFDEVCTHSLDEPPFPSARNGSGVYFHLNEDGRNIIGDHKLIQLSKTFDGNYRAYIILGMIVPPEALPMFFLSFYKFPCMDYDPQIHKIFGKSDEN